MTVKPPAPSPPLPHPIAFLDVEASGLGVDSYPIEVGWAFLHGGSGAMLIRPAPEWTLEAWDPSAEEIHGLSWEQLQHDGRPARDVAERLNQVLGGAALVLSDAHLQDSFWLRRLFEETPEMQAFELSDERLARDNYFPVASTFRGVTDHKSVRSHRAEPDARDLLNFWRQLLGWEYV